MTTTKGELKLCRTGQKLFDEYVERIETNNYVGTIAEIVKEKYGNQRWRAYQEHRLSCEECGYE